MMPVENSRSDLATVTPATAERWLAERQRMIESLLPDNLDFRRLARTAVLTLTEVPSLQECTGASVFGGILAAAQLGLPLGKAQQKAYLLPFRDKGVKVAQLVIGVPGYLDLAARSGIAARCGHTVPGQAIEVDEASGLIRVGLPPDGVDIYAAELSYAWASWAPVGHQEARFVRVWNRATVEGVRKRSKNPDGPGWRGSNYNAMATTRVLGSALKKSPMDAAGGAFRSMDQSVISVGDGVLTLDTEDGMVELTAEMKPNEETKPNGGEQNAEKAK